MVRAIKKGGMLDASHVHFSVLASSVPFKGCPLLILHVFLRYKFLFDTLENFRKHVSSQADYSCLAYGRKPTVTAFRPLSTLRCCLMLPKDESARAESHRLRSAGAMLDLLFTPEPSFWYNSIFR